MSAEENIRIFHGIVSDPPKGKEDQKLDPGHVWVRIVSLNLDVVARPCLPDGWHATPRAGSLVVVQFAAGLRTPVWTGVVYPPQEGPHTPEDELPTLDHRIFRSHAGHVLCLDDTEGSERVVLQDVSKNVFTMDKDGITIKCGDSASMQMKSSGELVLTCGSNKITLDSGGIEIVDGSGNSFKMSIAGAELNGQGVLLAPILQQLMAGTCAAPGAPVGYIPPLLPAIPGNLSTKF